MNYICVFISNSDLMQYITSFITDKITLSSHLLGTEMIIRSDRRTRGTNRHIPNPKYATSHSPRALRR